MRKLLLIALVLAGCQKQVIKPELPKVTVKSFTQVPFSAVNIVMYVEGVKTDATMIKFKDSTSTAYVKNEDAPYFMSWESIANLMSLSSNKILQAPEGVPLAINTRPYKPNDTIPLRIYARKGGWYKFKVTSYNAPYKMCILDNGWKCNLDSGFTVDLADSSTFYNRFKFVVKW